MLTTLLYYLKQVLVINMNCRLNKSDRPGVYIFLILFSPPLPALPTPPPPTLTPAPHGPSLSAVVCVLEITRCH